LLDAEAGFLFPFSKKKKTKKTQTELNFESWGTKSGAQQNLLRWGHRLRLHLEYVRLRRSEYEDYFVE
jgi:hypothetical protein